LRLHRPPPYCCSTIAVAYLCLVSGNDMGSDILIRHLEPADLPQIRELYAESHAFANTLQLPFQSLDDWARKLDTSRDGLTCLVAVRGDEIVGQFSLEVFRSPRRCHAASIGRGERLQHADWVLARHYLWQPSKCAKSGARW